MTAIVALSDLRARFAVGLAELYGREVPAYTTLVDVSRQVNEDHIRRHGRQAERLGSIDRVTAERHGAIRVGSPAELAQVARLFAGFGMKPVGFYDLRGASLSSVPVVSTAFRPTAPDELARNPFRVFTSMLVSDDRRFFDEATQRQLETFIAARRLFGEELLGLADRSAVDGGLSPDDADRFLALATVAFELSPDPIDEAWYRHLKRISAVAADIGGSPSTHINHLTPRVLGIDDLYARMSARGITMIDEIQGPPAWAGPDVLLRQTSFRALDESRLFRQSDGTVTEGLLRVRFGEVEQRGIALTERGRDVYERATAEVVRRLHAVTGREARGAVAAEIWADFFPIHEVDLALSGLGFFTYRVASSAPYTGTGDLRALLTSGAVVAEPIVYEDFLPRSAAGIFQSNLADKGSRDDAEQAKDYDMGRLSESIGLPIDEPVALYRRQQDKSLAEVGRTLGVTVTGTPTG
ncbi:VOC family protein [Streptosporangium sp. NPDC006013]|uniref:2-oxoadipate dioxygenase/decarboxylase n=1 Tax=Streptosporangium sp. NPDC006013 TaxID=3155596 RepID=UPI0033A3D2ED